VTEEKKNKEQEQAQTEATEAWNEVGRQFKSLTESLVSAFNASVQDEKVQQQLNSMQAELDTAAARINQTAKEASESATSINVEAETKKMGKEAHTAGQDLVKDVQPYLLSVLRKMQSGVDRIINDIEQKDSASFAEEETDSDEAESKSKE